MHDRPDRPPARATRHVAATRRWHPSRSWRPGRGSRGQSMVEFALILPVMLFLMAIAVDFGRLFYAYIAVENAAKEGALFGSRSPLCVDSSNVACPDPINVLWRVENEASNLQSGGTSLLNTQITCRAPNGTLRQPINDCVNGDTYIVAVTYDFGLITPILSSVLGSGMTLASTSEARVIGDAFDPSGIQALIFASTANSDNAVDVSNACTLAEAGVANYYFAPCQDSLNVDRYLEFQEGQTVTFKVRIKNAGNIALTNLTYTYAVNGAPITTPAGCNGGSSLATSLGIGSAPTYCTFNWTATASGGSVNDLVVSITAQGLASGVSTGDTSGVATVKVVPRPRLALTLRAAPYRLGDDGDGVNGSLSYAYTSPLTLQRQATSPDVTIQRPTGWLYLAVSNSGGTANNLSLGVTRGGTPLDLAALGCPPIPGALGAVGGSGTSYSCVFPQDFATTANFDFVASTSATNAIVTGSPSFRVTTADCATTSRVVPNMVDTLDPADKTNKVVSQAQAAWTSAGLTGTLTATPSTATNYVITQSRQAYTCVAPGSTATITTQVDQP